jgi:hypothetical protein
MSGTMALAQAIGADLARPRPTRRMDAYTTFLSIKWLLLGGLFGLPIVFNAAGIAMSDATTAFLGAAIGITLNMIGWYLGFKFLYRPEKLPRWWLRLSLQGSAFAGAVAALAIGHA